MGRCADEQVQQMVRIPVDEPAGLLGGANQIGERREELSHVLVDQPVHAPPSLASLVRHEPMEARVLRAEADEVGEDQPQLGRRIHAPQALEARAVHAGKALIEGAENRTPKPIFALEVIGYESVLHVGVGGDRPRGSAFEPVLRKFGGGGLEDPVARLDAALLTPVPLDDRLLELDRRVRFHDGPLAARRV